jgi:hypothetical protein
MLPAVAYTDYTLNTLANGTGTDVTLQVAVETVYTANSVLFTVNSPVDCYLTKLQARGTSVVDQANVLVEAEDESSIAVYGENNLSLDMPYSGDVALGNQVVQYLLFLEQQTSKRVNSVSLLLNDKFIQRQKLIVQREISDRIGVTEPMNVLPVTQIAGHHINAISMGDDADGNIMVNWVVTIADATVYWELGIPGRTELNYTTRLAYGLVIGHTDLAHVDTHTDIAHADAAHDDTHGDVIHKDAAHFDQAHQDLVHVDTAHSDAAHNDTHSDVSHYDVTHTDQHSDSAHRDSHGDTPHQDVQHNDDPGQAYWDTHGDVPHQDSPGQGHTDTHSDVHDDYTYSAHEDYHEDYPNYPGHFDSHNDSIHFDVHQDAHGDEHRDTHGDHHIDDGGYPHGDYHDDSHNDKAGRPHGDIGHTDNQHTDMHTDDAHGDTHSDVAHQDVPYVASHNDTAHIDVAHNDVLHIDGGHGDAAHNDTVHTDTHTDIAHVDVIHVDSHGDTSHGDVSG